MKKIIPLFIIATLISTPAWAWKQNFQTALKNGSAYVVDQKGKTLFEHRIHENFMPASTMKVATAACALDVLGKDYRFRTEFFTDNQNTLFVKGYGDPLLISEEWPLVAKGLKSKGLKKVKKIILDDSFFAPGIVIDGTSHSSNPYDAMNSALLTNFNTINVQVHTNGKVTRGEPQTPLTPIAYSMSKNLQPGKQRVNLKRDRNRTLQYFGELMSEFLQQENIKVDATISAGKVPENTKPFYIHYSSKKLPEVLEGLLKYSTNVTTNQVFLTMGAEKLGAPATAEKGAQVLTEFLKKKVGWKNFNVVEGSGLSRKNKVNAAEMMKLLDYFKPHRNLLPIKDGLFQAKTGTLTGANTYAGYFTRKNGDLVQFVILVNDAVAFNYKFKLAHQLYQGLN